MASQSINSPAFLNPWFNEGQRGLIPIEFYQYKIGLHTDVGLARDHPPNNLYLPARLPLGSA